MDKIRLHITAGHGVPALWEAGGGQTNIGDAFIISNQDGSRKRAMYVQRSGHLSCLAHALVRVYVGDILVSVSRSGVRAEVHVDRIEAIDDEGEELFAHTQELTFGVVTLEAEALETKDRKKRRVVVVDEQWDHPETAQQFHEAVNAALWKSVVYHCRVGMYVLPPEPKSKVDAPEPSPEEALIE